MRTYEKINWKEKNEEEVMNYLFDELEDNEQYENHVLKNIGSPN